MWCSACQQEVPGRSAASENAVLRCARCGGLLGSFAEAPKVEVGAENLVSSDAFDEVEDLVAERPAPLPADTWQMDEELREVRRMLRVLKVLPPGGGAPENQITLADGLTPGLPAWHAELPLPAVSKSPPRSVDQGKRRSSFLAWAALSLGLMTFVCGGVLLGFSFTAGRTDLWRLGMPLALAGLAALVVGLVLQLENLWQSNRDTSNMLGDLDTQLRDLRHATTMLSTTHSSSAQSFYAHVAEGASPQLLLADLKGQLDLLAVQMAKERR